jgi:hypothetical protein
MIDKIKWSKKMPRRQGIYLIKYPQSNTADKYETVYLTRYGKNWSISDYPCLHITEPVEDVVCEWGARIE